MDEVIINDLEDEYTSGKCIELACALARKHSLKISAFIFLEDDKGNILSLSGCNKLLDIPEDKHGHLIIDHVYATDGKNFYDFYGKTNQPQYMCEHQSAFIHNLTEDDICRLTELSKSDLYHRMDKAEEEVIKQFPERFNIQKTKNKPRKNKP